MLTKVRRNGIDENGMKDLPNMKQFLHLDISGNPTGDALAKTLEQRVCSRMWFKGYAAVRFEKEKNAHVKNSVQKISNLNLIENQPV